MSSSSSPPSSSSTNKIDPIKSLKSSLRKVLVSEPIASAPSLLTSPLANAQTSIRFEKEQQKQQNQKQNTLLTERHQKPIQCASLTPQDFAKLSPAERDDLKQKVLNYTKITSTLAVSPKRQTSNWHGTFLEPFCDHNNTLLHPSPGPGQYYVDDFYKKADHKNMNFCPTKGGRFSDDVTIRNLPPCSTKYQKLEDLSTIEVNVQGVKKKVVAKDLGSVLTQHHHEGQQNHHHIDSSETNTNRTAATTTTISSYVLTQNNLPLSPWRKEQERQHRELMKKLKKESRELQALREKEKKGESVLTEKEKERVDYLCRSTFDRENVNHQLTYDASTKNSKAFERIRKEEKERKKDEDAKSAIEKKGFSIMSSPMTRDASMLHTTEVACYAAPGSYDHNNSTSTIYGRAVASGSKKVGGTINVPLVHHQNKS